MICLTNRWSHIGLPFLFILSKILTETDTWPRSNKKQSLTLGRCIQDCSSSYVLPDESAYRASISKYIGKNMLLEIFH